MKYIELNEKRSIQFLATFNDYYDWYEVEGIGRRLIAKSDVKEE